MKLHRTLLLIGTCIALRSAEAASEMPQGFTFQGRFFNQAGTAPLTDTVDLVLGILSPDGSCLLYQEQQTGIDLSSTEGLFALTVGSFTGDPKRTASDPGLSTSVIFRNSGTLRADDSGGTNTCPGGYTPAAGAIRLLRVTVTPQSTGISTTLSPDQSINGMPFANVAQTLQGYTPSSFIFSTGNVTQANLGLLTGGTDILSTLHNHDSLYLKVGESGSQNFGSGISYSTGQVGIGTSSPGGKFEINTATAGTVGQIISGTALQSADYFQVKNSSGSTLLKIDSGGFLTLPGDPTTASQAATKNYVDANTQSVIDSSTVLDAGSLALNLQAGLVLNPFNTAAGNTGELRFQELAAGGADYVGFKAPDSIATPRVWTLPSADGAANACLATDGSGNLNWRTSFGNLTSISGTSPISVSAGATPIVSISTADASTTGALSSTDWNAFSAKVDRSGDTMTGTLNMTPAVNSSALAISGASLTGSNAQSFLDLVGTWNTSGTPTAIKANVTDTASSVASLLLDLQVGGTSKFKVSKSGIATLGTDPSGSLDAATKQYVDAAISTEGGSYIRKDGTVAFTGDQSLGNFKLTNVGDPTSAQDASTKNYVDTISVLLAGSSTKTGALTLSGTAADAKQLVVRGHGSQSVNLQEWQNGAGTMLAAVSSTGGISAPTFTGAHSGDGSALTGISATSGVSGILPIANGGTNSSTALTNHQVMVSSAGKIIEAGAMTNGQLLIGSTGAAPTIASLTGTSNQVSVTGGAGSITLSTPQNIHTGASPTFAGMTLSGLTEGSVPVVGSSGIISQSNSSLFWDATNSRLGINTNTPTARLQVNSTVGGADPLILRDSGNSGNARFYFSAPLGSAPDLNIETGAGGGGRIFLRGNTRTNSIDAISGTLTLANQGAIRIGSSSSIEFRTNVNDTTIFRGGGGLDTTIRPYYSGSVYSKLLLAPDGGNIGMGTSSPTSKLDVNGGISVGSYAGVTAAPSNGMIISGNVSIGKSTNSYPLDVVGDINTTTCLRIAGAQTTGTCSSDRKLKTKIRDYDLGLKELLRLKPRIYELNGLAGLQKGTEEVGFIAQEIEGAIPSLVVKRDVKLHEDDKKKTEIKAINYTRFIYIAINAIKELFKKSTAHDQAIAKLEIENATLKSDNAALKAWACSQTPRPAFCN